MKFTKKEKNTENKQLYQAEYKHVRTLRFVYMIVTLFLLTGFLWIGYFVYNNVFRSLEQVNTIAILRSELDLKTISVSRLETIEKRWEERKMRKETSLNIPNPFDQTTEQPAEPSVSTSTVQETPAQEPNQPDSPANTL